MCLLYRSHAFNVQRKCAVHVSTSHVLCVNCTVPMHSMSKEIVQSMFLRPMFRVFAVRFPCIQCPKKLCSPCFYVPCFVCLLYGSHAFNFQRKFAVHVSTSQIPCVCCAVPMHSMSKENVQSMCLLPIFRVFAIRFPCIQCAKKMCSPCVHFPCLQCLLYGSHAFNVQRKCAVHVSTSHVLCVCCTAPTC
jgi:hypothetical protein